MLPKFANTSLYSPPAETGGLVAGVTTNFSENLLRLIRIRGISQRELAKQIGVGESLVSHWCTGDHLPRPRHWDKLVEILKCEYTDLVGDPEAAARPIAPVFDDLIKQMAHRAGYEIVKRPNKS